MKLRQFSGMLLAVAGLCLVAGCGDSNSDHVINIAFTPIPAPTPIPKLCGNGVVDTDFGEQCDPAETTSSCGAGESCVCCVCLMDGEDLGERDFSIANPPSAFLSTALAGGNVSNAGTWLPGPLKLVAGRPDPNLPGEDACSAPLSLSEDVIFGFNVVDSTVLCNKFFAEGSSGTIDCDGGTAHDVLVTQNSNGKDAADPVQIQTGLGDPIAAGPGAATLDLARIVSVHLPFGFGSRSPADCATIDYEHARDIPGVKPADVIDQRLVLTTTSGNIVIMNPSQGGSDLSFAKPGQQQPIGQNFSCGTWTQEDSSGIFIGPIPGLDTSVGDTADVFFLADKPQ